MSQQSYPYIIIGAGLAGASAVEGIRQRDPLGPILMLGTEKDLPYDRPPLSKQLWTGAKKLEEVFLHPKDFYDKNAVTLRLATEIIKIDPAEHRIHDRHGNSFQYARLLLATGGTPRRLDIPGGDLDGILYYRTVSDYRKLRAAATPGKSALVIGGGFIGSEIAAALNINQLAVTMIFPAPWLVSHVFPEPLGRHLTEYYRSKGVEVVTADAPLSIEHNAKGYTVQSRAGRTFNADIVVAGIGITPNIALAQNAGLTTADGVIVNEFLQTSDPDIYAAGDITHFPEAALGPRRIEHWDNAKSQGLHAGQNMAGANTPFTYMPFFFSDLFEFGYEAVGQIDSRLHTFADWQEENKTGVIYYLEGDRLRGAMMCNVWEKTDAARTLIKADRPASPESLRGAIK